MSHFTSYTFLIFLFDLIFLLKYFHIIMAILPISLTILFAVCMLYGVGKVHGLHGPRVEIKGNYVDLVLFSHLYVGSGA